MVRLAELVSHSDRVLEPGRYRDYCPNGLQVQGAEEVTHLVTGVTASLALIDAAIEAGGDALLVHHGYFWKGERPVLTGMKYRRIARLIGAGMGLLAYHLPLDGHPELGNNAQLAHRLGFRIERDLLDDPGPGVVVAGTPGEATDGASLAARVGAVLGRDVLHIPGEAAVIRRIGWCTGAGQGFVEEAARQGMDAFLSGEISEQTTHVARECGIHYFSAGHHATERFGVAALGEYLAGRFGLRHTFIDIPNPA